MKQGAYAEGKVRDWLQTCKEDNASFTYNRLLDAHSSRGFMSVAQAGDFQWFLDTGKKVTVGPVPDGAWAGDYERPYTRNGVIEVKEVKHAYRLPVKNFEAEQVGRLWMRELAGSETLVIICFRPEGERPMWRTAPLTFFKDRPSPSGSWDFRDISAYPVCGDILRPYINI